MNLQPVEEQELIRGLIAREEKAYRIAFQLYGKLVLNAILKMVPRLEEAEDLTQEVFIELFHSVSKFRGESKLSTWIYRIAIRKSLDHIKAGKRKKRWGKIFGLSDLGQLEPRNLNHPGVMLEDKEEAEMLYAAIELLPDQQRTAFVLARMEGLKQDEVAAIMNTTIGAVESLLVRANKKLREELKHKLK